MNPQEEIALIEEIIQEILGAIQQATQSGEELPDELQGIIAQELDWAANRIVELQQENPVEGLRESGVPELEPGPFPSSNVNAFKYDPKSQRLYVKFHGKDSADSGPVYGYEGIPPFLYDVFRRGAVAPKSSGRNRYHQWHRGVTPSLGASMSALIKGGGYAYQRLS